MFEISTTTVIYGLFAILMAVGSWLVKGLFDRVASLEDKAALKTDLAELKAELRDHRQESNRAFSEVNEGVKQILLKMVEK